MHEELVAGLIVLTRVHSLNSGCLLNIGNGPQSGQPLYSEAKGPSVCNANAAKGRNVAHHCVERPISGN